MTPSPLGEGVAAGQRNALVVLTPPDQITLHHLPVPQDGQLQGLMLRASRILYQAGSDTTYQSEGAQTLTFYSLPRTDVGKMPLAPTTVYTGTRTLSTRQYTKSWYAATAWLTYTTPTGELHSRRYDGTGDVLLERGVSSFAASPFFALDWDDP